MAPASFTTVVGRRPLLSPTHPPQLAKKAHASTLPSRSSRCTRRASWRRPTLSAGPCWASGTHTVPRCTPTSPHAWSTRCAPWMESTSCKNREGGRGRGARGYKRAGPSSVWCRGLGSGRPLARRAGHQAPPNICQPQPPPAPPPFPPLVQLWERRLPGAGVPAAGSGRRSIAGLLRSDWHRVPGQHPLACHKAPRQRE